MDSPEQFAGSVLAAVAFSFAVCAALDAIGRAAEKFYDSLRW